MVVDVVAVPRDVAVLTVAVAAASALDSAAAAVAGLFQVFVLHIIIYSPRK